MSARQYSSIATAKTLNVVGGITDSATTIVLSDGTGLPTAPYTLVIEPDTANEEIVTVTAGTYTGLTVVRGVDGSTAVAHDFGSPIRHMLTARDVQELQNHVEASSVYTINNPNASSGTAVMPVHGITTGEGSVVGTAKTQTLTAKTINLADNTVTGTKAQFNTAMSDADFATLAGSETLSNKTLSTPTINSATLTSPALNGTVNIASAGSVSLPASSSITIGGTALSATATELNYTDGMGDAWASHTPTVTGSWTSVSASTKYRKIGRIVHFRTTISAVSVGTVDSISFTLPATPAADFAFAGHNNAWYPMAAIGGSSGTATAQAYTYPYGGWDNASATFIFSGTYESAS